MASVLQRNQSGFDALMRGRSDEQRSYVIEKLEGMGTTVADPWYLQLANITLLGMILEQVPSEYRQTVQEAQRQFFEQLHQEMDSLENVKASSVEVKIASAVERLLAERTGDDASPSPAPSEVPIPPENPAPVPLVPNRPFYLRLKVLLPIVLALGMGIGSALTSLFLPKSYIHAGVELSPKDSALLGWVKSEEGQFARDLIHWNGKRLD